MPIWPFSTNKALSGLLLHRDRALLPSCPPQSGIRSGLHQLCYGSQLRQKFTPLKFQS